MNNKTKMKKKKKENEENLSLLVVPEVGYFP
jgi:hypothetical protein